jgi:hypothetical protein
MFDKTKTVAWIAVAILVLVAYTAWTLYEAKPKTV